MLSPRGKAVCYASLYLSLWQDNSVSFTWQKKKIAFQKKPIYLHGKQRPSELLKCLNKSSW